MSLGSETIIGFANGRIVKGAIGTSMGGPSSSRKWALKRNLPALIHAQDILKLHAIGEPDVNPKMLELCNKAVTSPSLLEPYEKGMIDKQWIIFAEAGKLRGIRSKTYPQ